MDDPHMRNALATLGFYVIRDVLPLEEFETYSDLFGDYLADLTADELLQMDRAPHGVQKYHEVGHQRFAWYLRTRPSIQAPFKRLYRTDDLVTSFDGINYQSGTRARRDTHWAHSDQAPANSDFRCYQAVFSLTTNLSNTLVIWPKSHRVHAEHAAHYGLTHKRNWQKVEPEFLVDNWLDRTVIPLPANSLVIWDSRLIHQNQYGQRPERRICQYISYLPRHAPGNTPAQQTKRRAHFHNRRMTSHWAYPISTNSRQPQHYGDLTQVIDYDAIPAPDLADLMPAIEALL